MKNLNTEETVQDIEDGQEDYKILKVNIKQGNILSEEFLEPYKTEIPPFGPLGFVTYKRTYARRIEKENRTEEWWETCKRCVEAIVKLGCRLSQEEAERFFDYVFNLKCCFSGRSLWQLGTKTVARLGGASLNACWGLVIDNTKSFIFAMDMLCLGGGIGFNIQKEFIYKLPKIKKNVKVTRIDATDSDYICPDSREGWCRLLNEVFNAYFETGKSFSYSLHCIRSAGASISGFGGKSSGPEFLHEGIQDIGQILRSRQGKQLRPIDCLDIMNIIGRVVVSGNVRRSALLCLGDMDDVQYLRAKRWDLGDIPNYRKHSNNSIVCNDINLLPEEFWKGYEGNGEPYGLINLKLAQEKGRVLDSHRTDPDVAVFNPCAEISLSPFEACNLIEIFLPSVENKTEFLDICKLVYRVVKTIAAQKYHYEETQHIVEKNMRLGISVTGICDVLPKIGEKALREWLDNGYQVIEKEDVKYSADINRNTSIKLTCLKPSGTLSLLNGCSAGVHPSFSPYYIRRIRFSANDPLIPLLRENKYLVEPAKEFDGSLNRDTLVVSFPVKARDGAICTKDLTAIQQLDLVKMMNEVWSDNSTSCTVFYKKNELDDIKQWLKQNYNTYIKAVSFLLFSEHGFTQAPYEEIDKNTCEEMLAKVTPIYSINDTGAEFDAQELECKSGACPIK